MNHDVVVIGAGVSGLSCAHQLAGNGFDVRVLERQVHIGGNAKSQRFDGFLMEHGPTTLNASFPGAMKNICKLGLDTSARALGPDVRKRYLRDERGLHGISVHPMGFFTSGYLSPLARLSMATEFLRSRKSGENEETIHQFATRRFGSEFADKIIEPMAAGMFMGDSKALSVSGVFPKLMDLEQKFGSITRGVLAAKRGSEPGRKLLSWDNGIATLPRTLAKRLGGKIHTGIAVTKIIRKKAGFEVSTAKSGTISCRAVVLAVQPHVASSLLEELDPVTANVASEIAAPPIAVIYLGYKKNQISHPLDGLGFLSTKNPDQAISGAQFCSTMFEGRAPDGHASISCYVGGARNPDLVNLSEDELLSIVETELSDLLGIKGSPIVSRTQRWPRGLPHYTLGHQQRRTIIEAANQRVPGLFLTGNFLGGVSLTNCLETANSVAKNVQAELEKTSIAHDIDDLGLMMKQSIRH